MSRRDMVIQRIRDELLGRYFSNRSELRHIAEGAGFDFVPVEILTAGESEAQAVLHPEEIGEVRVKAVRSARWHPFYITDVEPVRQDGDNGRPTSGAERRDPG